MQVGHSLQDLPHHVARVSLRVVALVQDPVKHLPPRGPEGHQPLSPAWAGSGGRAGAFGKPDLYQAFGWAGPRALGPLGFQKWVSLVIKGGKRKGPRVWKILEPQNCTHSSRKMKYSLRVTNTSTSCRMLGCFTLVRVRGVSTGQGEPKRSSDSYGGWF